MDNGAYDLQGCIWHTHSNRLLIKIMELWPNKQDAIVDLGCGHNFYTNVLKLDGRSAIGIDAVPMNGVDLVADITNLKITRKENGYVIIDFGKKEVWWLNAKVISLECGEHVPYEKCFAYLDNVTAFGGDIIMSWAVPGQAGHGHINCQSNLWVISQMSQRGYSLDAKLTDELREAVKDCSCTWFKNTIMYFKPQ